MDVVDCGGGRSHAVGRVEIELVDLGAHTRSSGERHRAQRRVDGVLELDLEPAADRRLPSRVYWQRAVVDDDRLVVECRGVRLVRRDEPYADRARRRVDVPREVSTGVERERLPGAGVGCLRVVAERGPRSCGPVVQVPTPALRRLVGAQVAGGDREAPDRGRVEAGRQRVGAVARIRARAEDDRPRRVDGASGLVTHRQVAHRLAAGRPLRRRDRLRKQRQSPATTREGRGGGRRGRASGRGRARPGGHRPARTRGHDEGRDEARELPPTRPPARVPSARLRARPARISEAYPRDPRMSRAKRADCAYAPDPEPQRSTRLAPPGLVRPRRSRVDGGGDSTPARGGDRSRRGHRRSRRSGRRTSRSDARLLRRVLPCPHRAGPPVGRRGPRRVAARDSRG